MTKQAFLRSIRQDACFKGSDSSILWPIAVEADEKDPRWQSVDYSDGDLSRLTYSFARAFAVALPGRYTPPTAADRLAELKSLLAFNQAHLTELAAADLDEKTKAACISRIRERISRLEKQIADALPG